MKLTKQRNEDGAVLVEVSLVTLLLVTLCLGMVEYGNIFNNSIDVSSAARDAARTGAATTDVPVSDSQIIQSMLERNGLSSAEIEKVVIYRADDPDGRPSAACTESYPPPAGSKCNVYRSEDLEADVTLAPQEARRWPAGDRRPGVDYIGVWVLADYSPVASLIWSPDHFADHVAMRIEPSSYVAGNDFPRSFSTGNTQNPGFQWYPYANWGGVCTTCTNGGTGSSGSGGAGGSA